MTVKEMGPASVTGWAFSSGDTALTFLEFLGSAAVGAIFTALVALHNSERRILIENITQERAKWRDKIREKAVEVSRAATDHDRRKLLELRREFLLNLNPFDPIDNGILAQIQQLADARDGDRDSKINELFESLAYLLKHDWERAKREARLWKRPCQKEISARPR